MLANLRSHCRRTINNGVKPAWIAYKMRWRRRGYLYRALRSRKQLTAFSDKTSQIKPDDILAFSTVRNEMIRLPFFLAHHRALGVQHFIFVDNDSEDGTSAFLAAQADVSVWITKASYKAARFGVDWLGYLQWRFAPGHWALTLDADEVLIYPGHEGKRLSELTQWLDGQSAPVLPVLMLDMYPKGPLSAATYQAGDDPSKTLPWFDADNYTWERLAKFQNFSIRGGVRKRVFFEDAPDHAPHLHKTPLVKWRRSYVYVNSTHLMLPRSLNAGFDARKNLPTGVLLHSKFLNIVVEKSGEEKHRAEHFTHADRYNQYYDRIVADPDLWHAGSVRYTGAAQLEELGLMTRGHWPRV